MSCRKMLGLFLLKAARLRLASKGVELRCSHEVHPFEPGLFNDSVSVNVETIEKYYQPEEQANLEREMITQEVNLILMEMA